MSVTTILVVSAALLAPSSPTELVANQLELLGTRPF